MALAEITYRWHLLEKGKDTRTYCNHKDQCEIYILSGRVTNDWINFFFLLEKFGFHSSNLFIKVYDNSIKKQVKNDWLFSLIVEALK